MSRWMKNPGWIGAIVAVALVVRVVLVLASPHYVPLTDAADFDADAVSLVQHGHFPSSRLTAHGGPTAFRPPLFPLVLAGVDEVVGVGDASARWEAGRLVEAVLGVLVVWLVCLVGVRVFGRGVGLVAGGLAAVYPPLVLVGSSLLSESLFIPLVVGAVLAALRFRDDRRLRWVVVSGVLVGLGALTRGNGIVLLVPLVLLVWGRPWRRWGAVRAPAVLVVVAVLVLVPWTVRNAEVFGRFVPLTTETGYALAGVYNPGAQHDPQYPALWRVPAAQIFTFIRAHPHAEEPEISDHLTSQALDYVKAHAGSVPRTLFWSVVRLFNFSGAGLERYLAPFQGYGRGLAEASVYAFWLLLALAIGGAFTPYRRRLPRAMWTWPLMIVISCLVFEGDTRYRSPADPFFILLAAALIATIYHRRADDRAAPARRSDQLVPHA